MHWAWCSFIAAGSREVQSFLCTYNLFSFISEEFIWATFDHVGLTNSKVKHPPNPYPENSFPFSGDFESKSIVNHDTADINEFL